MSGIESKSADFVATAFAAALDDSLWPSLTADLMHAIGCAGGTFFVIDSKTGRPHRMAPLWPERATDEYFQHYWEADPLRDLVSRANTPMIAAKGEYLIGRDEPTADYVKWYNGVGGFDEHITAVTPLKGTNFRCGFTFHRSIENGPVARQERLGLADVFLQARQALQLGFAHASMLEEAYWNGIAATGDPDPAFLIGESGSVMRMNDAAIGLLRAQDGLTMKNDRLFSPDQYGMKSLNLAIKQAIAQHNPRSGATQLRRPSGKRAYAAVTYPLPHQRRWLAPLQASALLKVADLTMSRGRLVAAQDLFRLSPRESEIMSLIWEGHSPESCAAYLGISLATCRSHLRSIMAKTGVSRQAELISVLARVSR